MIGTKLLSFAALAVVGASLLAGRAGAAPDAYYTSAQATDGAKSYAADCAQCHGAKLEGGAGPALTGSGMKGSQSIGALYTYMAKNMPLGRAGQLPETTYTAIFAYILQQNDHPAGSTALTAADAKKIQAKI